MVPTASASSSSGCSCCAYRPHDARNAVAKKWKADASQCYAENHAIKHKGSNRSLGFGERPIADAKQQPVPAENELQFKPRAQWRYIGKDIPITDLDDIVTGKAIFGIDGRMDNQLFAVIARPPVVGGKVVSFDATKAKQLPGVIEAIEIPAFEVCRTFNRLVESPC